MTLVDGQGGGFKEDARGTKLYLFGAKGTIHGNFFRLWKTVGASLAQEKKCGRLGVPVQLPLLFESVLLLQ